MIKKIKSKLAVKVFLLTALLMAACCAITYLCIARFAPYIYTHELSEAEDNAYVLFVESANMSLGEVQNALPLLWEELSDQLNDEFVMHIFQKSGEEVALSDWNAYTGKRISDYQNAETTQAYTLSFADSADEYIVLLSKNADKESQVVEALQKSLPVLSAVVLLVSIVAAFFYTAYLTKPIRQVSRVSEKMANMDFHSLCPTGRTDEIGALAVNLNTLSGRLGAALSDLQKANRRLQADIDRERELERQRVEFFAAASHELKTPITIIKGQLQGMLYRVGRYRDRETYLAQSLAATGTLEKMVQELLTISRLDAPEYVCKKSDVDLSALVRERLAAHEDLFLQKEQSIEASIAPDAHISGDARLLQKALDNLIGNAAAYSGCGARVIVRLWTEDDRTRLTMENTGAQIPDSDIPRLFEPFYRVDPSRNRQTGGTGLGLYIVKTILDLHGAGIEIANSARGVIVSVEF